MASNDLSICNSAMIKLGVEKIASMDENSRAAVLCKEQYDKKRKQLLRSHYWNFAIKRHTFVSTGVTPEYEFSHQYELPEDYLRMASTEFPGQFYQVESGKLLSNHAPFKGKYVADVSDTTLFDPVFDEALALLIADDLCFSLTQDKGLKDRIQGELQMVLRDTRSFDAQENPAYPLMEDVFLNARN